MLNIDKAIQKFKTRCKDQDISCTAEKVNNDIFLILADLPDGEYYYIVTENFVSSAYHNKGDALRRIKEERKF